jgi:glutathionyl-hydroquinone reductase
VTSDGVRAEFAAETDGGRWQRQASHFTGRLSADGSSGWRAAPGAFHLVVSLACPWAHRQLIVRALKGLETALPVTIVDPWRDEFGWRFNDRIDATWPDYRPDPVAGRRYLSEAYLATDPSFAGRVTVPCILDVASGTVVTNEFRTIDIQINEAFDAVATAPDVDLYPAALRGRIDALDELLYDEVNNGVYKAGFATDQQAYDAAFDVLFARLDQLDHDLATQRYLCGDVLTLADIRLYTTLIRFDAVYHNHFRCNRRTVREYPVLWAYLRDLYQTPGFGSTTDFDHIKRHYYTTHDTLNPSRIVPRGPALDLDAPHGREALTS